MLLPFRDFNPKEYDVFFNGAPIHDVIYANETSGVVIVEVDRQRISRIGRVKILRKPNFDELQVLEEKV